MGHLIKDNAPLELYAWLDPDSPVPGWDLFSANPFSSTLPEEQFTTIQSYFAEYHLEYYRQRLHDDFPSRLHSLLLFATRVDAETFRVKHPARVSGKYLACARSSGDYTVSFHDSAWLDYLRLPHSLTLSTLDEISGYYWQGTLVEEVDLPFMGQRWREAPVIEALFQGRLETVVPPLQAALPGFA